jgi:Malectin domain/Putative Ig domain/Secretion system C-terminal sorting domain
VGVIASSGSSAPPFSASWDFINITNPAPYVIQPFPDQVVFTDQTTVTVPLTEVFDDDDGFQTLSFEVTDISNGALIQNTEVVGTDLILTLNPVVGETTVSLKATDPGGDYAETSFKISIIPEVVDVAHINSGGGSFQFNNTTWLSDQYYSGGGIYSKTSLAINNTTNDQLYQTERYGNFSYAIPVPATGIYYMDLHFAEIYHGVSNTAGVGARLFNVSVENNQFTLQNFDIFQQAGGAATAYDVRVENIQVSDGFLNISFTTVKDNAKISGISVYKYPSGAPTDAPPFVISPYPNQQVTQGQNILNVPLDQIFNDDNGFSNLTIEVTDISNPALVSSTQITNAQLAITLQPVLGSTTISLKATDQSLSFIETSFQVDILSSPQGGTPVVRINSGGSGLQFGTENWISDQYFTGGGTSHTTNGINNTTNDAIYQVERFGNVSYHIPVPQSGSYSVDLHFAEIYWTSVNKRIFSVSVENGQFVKQNLDLIQEFGAPYTAGTIRAEPIAVTDGFLDIVLTTVKDNAKISGICVFTYNAVNAAPSLQSPSDVTLVEGQFWSYQLQATDPNPGDILSYSSTGLPASLQLNASTGLIQGTLEVTADVFPVTVKVSDPDGEFDEKNFNITVRQNNPPSITTPPDATVDQGQPFSYSVIATDNDPGDQLTYTAQNLPDNLTINNQSGLISGNVADVAGPYNITLRATDPWGAFAETSFLLDVMYVNQPPLASVTVLPSYCRDTFVSIPINASDPENEALTFNIDPSGDPLPSGLSLDPSSGIISGTLLKTGNEGTSKNYSVLIKVTDPENNFTTVTVDILSMECGGGLQVTSLTLINSSIDVDFVTLFDGMVININDLPQSINIRADVNQPAGSVKFGWQGNPNYRVEGVAPYSLGGDNGGNYNDMQIGLGSYTTTATPYTNGGASGTPGIPLNITFYVVEENVNVPPIVNQPPDVVLKENESWTYQVVASDPGDIITYNAVNLPPSLNIDENTGLISGTITVPASVYDVTANVEDSEAHITSVSFKITINENRPPEISATVLPEFCRGTFITILVSASDPDNDILTFQLDATSDPLPNGLNLNELTGTISGTLLQTGNEGPSTLYNIILVVSDPDGETASTLLPIVSNDCGGGLQVTSLVLLNSVNDTDIITLYDGLALTSSTLPSFMNIKASVGPTAVGSVRFGWQGNASYRTENVAPYALGGDNNGDYNNMALGEGTYSITATPYPNTNASGAPGTPLSLTFSIVKSGGIAVARTASEVVAEGIPSDEALRVYPNPAGNNFYIKILVEQQDQFNFSMINTLGKQTDLGSYQLSEGKNLLHFDLEPTGFPPGMYYVAIGHGTWKKIIKLVIH